MTSVMDQMWWLECGLPRACLAGAHMDVWGCAEPYRLRTPCRATLPSRTNEPLSDSTVAKACTFPVGDNLYFRRWGAAGNGHCA